MSSRRSPKKSSSTPKFSSSSPRRRSSPSPRMSPPRASSSRNIDYPLFRQAFVSGTIPNEVRRMIYSYNPTWQDVEKEILSMLNWKWNEPNAFALIVDLTADDPLYRFYRNRLQSELNDIKRSNIKPSENFKLEVAFYFYIAKREFGLDFLSRTYNNLALFDLIDLLNSYGIDLPAIAESINRSALQRQVFQIIYESISD